MSVGVESSVGVMIRLAGWVPLPVISSSFCRMLTHCGGQVWDVDTGVCIHVLRGHFHQIYSVAFDGVRIASGGLDTTVRVWDAETG